MNMIFEHFEIKFKPKRKREFVAVLLITILIIVMPYVNEASYEYGTDWDINEAGYETQIRNGTMHGTYSIRTLSFSSAYPITWNLTVCDNISVFFNSDWWSEYFFNGTGGFYEGNSTYVSFYLLLNGTTGTWRFIQTRMTYDWIRYDTREFVVWRFLGNLYSIILGFGSSAFVFLLYDRFRREEPLDDLE